MWGVGGGGLLAHSSVHACVFASNHICIFMTLSQLHCICVCVCVSVCFTFHGINITFLQGLAVFLCNSCFSVTISLLFCLNT